MMFSIVIPMFNNSVHIINALESCVEQTYLPKEIIIVDDCSSDDSYALVIEWKKKYKGDVEIILKQLNVNSGPSKARNVGWGLASGEYVAFLDADDRFILHKLEALKDLLLKEKDIILLGHGYSTKLEIEQQISALKKVTTFELLKRNFSATPSVIIRKEIDERFDETMRYTEDHDLWLRVTQKYDQTYYLDTVLTVIDRPVRSEGGQSSNLWEMRKGEIAMYRKYCKDNEMKLLFPFLAVFSLGKHLYKKLREIQ